MNGFQPLLTISLALAIAGAAGCSSKAPVEQKLPEGVPYEVDTFAPDMREHHTSWGHQGRGGAALRKPAYQPVLGSPDSLDTRYGKLHPELQYKPQPVQAGVAVPPAMLADTCADKTAAAPVAQAFPLTPQPAASGTKRIYTLANSTGSVNDYIRVRNKVCKGAERLTYEEWEILVMGTPKDVPLRLQPSLLPIKK